MEIDKEFKDIRVFKGKTSSFCRIKDLMQTEVFSTYFELQNHQFDK